MLLQNLEQSLRNVPDMKKDPKRANKIGHYPKLEERQGKANMPGHVRASTPIGIHLKR